MPSILLPLLFAYSLLCGQATAAQIAAATFELPAGMSLPFLSLFCLALQSLYFAWLLYLIAFLGKDSSFFLAFLSR